MVCLHHSKGCEAATKLDSWGIADRAGLPGTDIDDLKMIAGIFDEIADHRES